MRIVVNYIIGALIGIALVLGFWWITPDAFRGEGDVADQIEVAPAQELQTLESGITVSRRNAITNAVREISPAVVGINVVAIREYRTHNPFFDDPFFRSIFPPRVWREKVENLGSGFIISPDGYVMTNQHVVHMATEIIVTMTDDSKYNAEVIGFDYDSDVALLKIDGEDLPYIRFGDSDDVIIGEWAIALGNPFGLFAIHSQPSVTVGVVSAVDRDFDRNQDGRLYQDMIQTDASINRGNSGGPLVNSTAELIGMNTIIFTESGGSIGLGFAIPSNKLSDMYNELRDRGEIERDFWIGLSTQNVDRLIAMSLKLPEIGGVVVTDVEPGSPAQKAGIEAPDVITSVFGRKVNNLSDIMSIIRNSDLRVGDELEMGIIRDGEPKTVEVMLEKKEG